jgi:methylated-DNA-[protein]-cysteine S-methyltransferase
MTECKYVYWTQLRHEDWVMHLAATEKGLCYAQFDNIPFANLQTWVKAYIPGAELIQDDAKMLPYTDELRQYFLGNITAFTFPIDSRGTSFQKSIWQALQLIPHGLTQSYSDIAAAIGRPSAVRAVGTAIGANPVLLAVPCHRVIGKQGALTGYRGGLTAKSALLKLEQRSLTSCSLS